MATGNTNRASVKISLHIGTQIMNVANFSRFEVIKEVKYMSSEHEIEVPVSRVKMIKGTDKDL